LATGNNFPELNRAFGRDRFRSPARVSSNRGSDGFQIVEQDSPMSDFAAKMDQLAGWITEGKSLITFTGAGISTESGIPDFRSPGGLWSKHKPVMYQDFLRDRAERVRYWRMRRALYREFESARPNPGHYVLARLEAAGLLQAIITQNIDGLHQDAGSRRVIELHGTCRVIACVSCDSRCPPEEILHRLDAGDEAPDCDHCGAPLKSRTVSFGQMMPPMEMQEASALSRRAEVFLSVGSSLVVEPAASFPRTAKHHGAVLVIINREETPLDPMADLILRKPIGETLLSLDQRVRDLLPDSTKPV